MSSVVSPKYYMERLVGVELRPSYPIRKPICSLIFLAVLPTQVHLPLFPSWSGARAGRLTDTRTPSFTEMCSAPVFLSCCFSWQSLHPLSTHTPFPLPKFLAAFIVFLGPVYFVIRPVVRNITTEC